MLIGAENEALQLPFSRTVFPAFSSRYAARRDSHLPKTVMFSAVSKYSVYSTILPLDKRKKIP
jgi:hypothetical protein